MDANVPIRDFFFCASRRRFCPSRSNSTDSSSVRPVMLHELFRSFSLLTYREPCLVPDAEGR